MSPTILNCNHTLLFNNHEFSNNINSNSQDASNNNSNLSTTFSSNSPTLINASSLISMTSFPQAQPINTGVNANSNLNVQLNASSSSSSSPSPVQQSNFNCNNINPSNTTLPSGSSQLVKTNNSPQNSLITPGSSKKRDKPTKQQADEEEDKEVIKVYDGNASFRKRIFKTIIVNKSSSHLGIVEASLRTFHINDDPNRYYITVPLSASNLASTYATTPSSNLDDYQIEELIVDETNPIKSIKSALLNSNNLDGPKPSIILRYKDSDNESIRIYPGIIK